MSDYLTVQLSDHSEVLKETYLSSRGKQHKARLLSFRTYLFILPKASIKVEKEKGSHYKANPMNEEIGKFHCIYSSYGVIRDQLNHFSKKKMQY